MVSACHNLRLVTRFSTRWLSTRSTNTRPSAPPAAVVTFDLTHLLENENGYGIAKPLRKDVFHMDHYHPKLQHEHQAASLTTKSINKL